MDAAAQIAILNVQIQSLVDKRSTISEKRKSAQTQYTIAAIAVLLGLLLIVFLSGAWIIGAFLLIAGLLAMFTQAMKRGKCDMELEEIDKQIEEQRKKIYDMAAAPAASKVPETVE